MKALKILGIAVGGLLLVLVAAIAFVAARFDADFVKAEAAKALLEKKQRRLSIDGPLELAFWPKLGVKVGRLSLSEHKSDKEFLAVESARVSVAVMPLFSKQIVVDTIEIRGAKATLVRHKDGTLNIADLLAPDNEPSPLIQFDIAGVQLSGSELVFRDEQAGASYAATALHLETGRLANAAEGPLQLAARVTASQPKTAADVTVTGRYRFDLAKQDYALAKLDAAVKGEVPGAKALDLKLSAASLGLQPDSKALTADGLALAAKGETAGVAGLDLTLSATRLALQPATSSAAIDKLALAARGKLGADAFDVKLEAPKLALAPDKAGGEKITLAAKLAGAQKDIAATLALSGVEGSAKAVKIGKLDLDLDAKLAETTAKGRLSGPVAVELEATSVALPRIEGALDVADPRMPMKQVKLPLAGHARANWGRQSAEGALDTRFDESKIAAKFSLARFTPPDIGFDLDIDRLNVDKYFPPAKKAAGKVGAGDTAGKGGAAGEKIDLAALKSLNLHGTVKVGQLQVHNVKASNVRLNINAAGGRLDVAPHSANLYDGTLSGALSVNANGNAVALRQNLANVSINPLLRDALEKDVLEGRGTVSLDLTTRGDTVTAMKKALTGNASLALKDGAIKGIDLAKTFRETKAKFSTRQDVVQAAKTTDKTDFTELTASFRINNGVARNDDLAAKSPFLRLSGAGDIDIGNERVDYLARATVVNTSAGQGGKDLEHLKGVTVPVRLSGPFDNISYKLELGSLIQEAVKEKAQAKVEEKKQELQKKATEKLQDSLKGLLRR